MNATQIAASIAISAIGDVRRGKDVATAVAANSQGCWSVHAAQAEALVRSVFAREIAEDDLYEMVDGPAADEV